MALVHMHARGDGPDRRQVDVIVGVEVRLVGGVERLPAGAGLGVDVARLVGIGAQGPRHAGPALAAFLARRRLGAVGGAVGLLALRRRQRRVRRRLRRQVEAPFEFGDACQQRLDPRQQLGVPPDQPIDPRQQLHDQRLQGVTIERIECLGRHPQFESARRRPRNAPPPSQTAAAAGSRG